MAKAINETGNVYGKLTVLNRAENDKRGNVRWVCRCECGNETVTNGRSLRRGHTKSCSCACGQRIDETGNVYGKVTVLRLAESKGQGTEWLCRCKCGRAFETTGHGLRRGHVKSCGCSRFHSGPANAQWKGGRINLNGYVHIYTPGHPAANGAYVLEHRLVMEKYLGRYLADGETIHHRNGVKDDNRIENLELWSLNHPAGQRVSDLVDWAQKILERYEHLAA